jgi:hypothetical protein
MTILSDKTPNSPAIIYELMGFHANRLPNTFAITQAKKLFLILAKNDIDT